MKLPTLVNFTVLASSPSVFFFFRSSRRSIVIVDGKNVKRARVTFLEAWVSQRHTASGLASSRIRAGMLTSVWLEFEAIMMANAEWPVDKG